MRASYPTYKSTSIPWLPEMPEHWEQVPLCSLIKSKSIKKQSDKPLLSVYRDYGVILKDSRDDNHNKPGEDLSNYKYVGIGNLVLNKMKTWQGSLGVSDHEGIVSPAYIVCNVSPKVHGRYLHHLLRCHNYIYEYNRLSYGIRVDQWDMHFEDFKRIPIFLPPLPEQTAIANYLDAKTDQINRFIEKKEKLIALLKEQKQAVINDVFADCKRKYPNLRLKYLAKINPTKSFSKLPIQDDDNVVFLPMEKVSEEGEIDCSLLKQTVELKNGFTFFEKGDIIVAKITPCFENGKGALLNNLATSYGFGSTEFHTIRPNKKKILPEYLRWVIYSEAFRSLGEYFMVGSAGQKRVPVEYVSNYVVALPSLEHQAQIVDEILVEVNRIDKAIKQIEIEVEKVKELKQSLIAEVVTGRIKVA